MTFNRIVTTDSGELPVCMLVPRYLSMDKMRAVITSLKEGKNSNGFHFGVTQFANWATSLSKEQKGNTFCLSSAYLYHFPFTFIRSSSLLRIEWYLWHLFLNPLFRSIGLATKFDCWRNWVQPRTLLGRISSWPQAQNSTLFQRIRREDCFSWETPSSKKWGIISGCKWSLCASREWSLWHSPTTIWPLYD